MMQNDISTIKAQTTRWIEKVVIGSNFCPFAAKEVKRNTVHYEVVLAIDEATILNAFEKQCENLNNNTLIETLFIIIPNAYQDFYEYLAFVKKAERLLKRKGYEGVYQVASFHPLYLFANAEDDDAANYTNRSIYPMLHLLREESIDNALNSYDKPENIPLKNIEFARKKGLAYMLQLRESCL